MTQTDNHIPPPSVTAESTPALRACLFSVSGARFAVDVRGAREVALFEELTAVPRAPRHLVGVANLRGTVIPIIDVGPLLGRPALRTPRSVRTLVLRDGPLLAAMVVEAVDTGENGVRKKSPTPKTSSTATPLVTPPKASRRTRRSTTCGRSVTRPRPR